LDLTETTLREWVKRADIDSGKGPPEALTTAEREGSMRDRKTENQVRRQQRLEQCAWVNHRALTVSEARLWAPLSGRKLGVQFRRQVP
jgi:hypothetical protein